MPANYTFVSGDNGVHTFTNATTLVTAGTRTVTATDTATPASPAPATYHRQCRCATHLTVSAPATATAGSPFSITVTALDQFNNTAKSYTGTVKFTTSDTGTAA